MSVNLRWRPTEGGKSFRGGTSSDLEVLRETFGDPIVIDESSLPILRAMQRVATYKPFYDELIDAVEKAGSITVWGEW